MPRDGHSGPQALSSASTLQSAARPPGVSVVISTLNRLDLLRVTLQSLCLQTYPYFEVLVVVGPRSSETKRYLAADCPNAQMIDCPLANLSLSRNLGWNAASGELIAFIDDDAVALPRWLERLSEAFVDPKVAAAGGFVRDHTGTRFQWQFLSIDPLCNPVELSTWNYEGPLVSDRPFDPISHRYKYPAGTNMIFRRSALALVGGFDETYRYAAEDADLCLRLYQSGFKLAHVPHAEVIHRYAPSHQRTVERVPRTLLDTVRSFVYFKLKNGRYLHDTKTIMNSVEDYLRSTERWVWNLRNEAKIDDSTAHRLIDEIELGTREAFARSLDGARVRVPCKSLASTPNSGIQPFNIVRRAPSRLRVCFVSQELPPAPSGGIGSWTWTVARALARGGHDVTVVSRTDDQSTLDLVDGCWVSRSPTFSYGARQTPDLSPLPLPIRDNAYRVLEQVRSLEMLDPFDVVSAPLWDVEGIGCLRARQGTNALSLHTPLRAQIRTSVNWRPDEHYMSQYAQPIFAAEAELLNQAPIVIANSQAILEEIEGSYGVIVPRSHLHMVPHGIDDVAQNLEHQSFGLSPFKRVLFVGRFDGRKGIDIVLAAVPEVMARHDDVVFEFCGETNISIDGGGTYLDRFRSQHSSQPWMEKVVFHGRVSEATLLDSYANCDIFVAPSRFESFGLIFLEAMRFAKPVIALNVGGAREIVEDNASGVLVLDEKPTSLAQAICRLLEDDELRLRMGREGRRRFLARFTSDRMASELAEIFLRARYQRLA